MGNAFTDAVGATVKKAKKTVDTYTQAAKDLAEMPENTRRGVAPYKEVGQSIDRTSAASQKSKKKAY